MAEHPTPGRGLETFLKISFFPFRLGNEWDRQAGGSWEIVSGRTLAISLLYFWFRLDPRTFPAVSALTVRNSAENVANLVSWAWLSGTVVFLSAWYPGSRTRWSLPIRNVVSASWWTEKQIVGKTFFSRTENGDWSWGWEKKETKVRRPLRTEEACLGLLCHVSQSPT